MMEKLQCPTRRAIHCWYPKGTRYPRFAKWASPQLRPIDWWCPGLLAKLMGIFQRCTWAPGRYSGLCTKIRTVKVETRLLTQTTTWNSLTAIHTDNKTTYDEQLVRFRIFGHSHGDGTTYTEKVVHQKPAFPESEAIKYCLSWHI